MNVKIPLAVGAFGLALVAIVTGAGIAQAAPDNPLKPAQVRSDGSFYSEEQIDAVWASITENYPESLPEGVTFPSLAPPFFHPDKEEGEPYFQTGLPELIAARYWRCAWLDAHLDSAESGQSAAQLKASNSLGRYEALPAVKDMVDSAAYERGMRGYAAKVGQDPLFAEFDVECAIYTEAGNQR